MESPLLCTFAHFTEQILAYSLQGVEIGGVEDVLVVRQRHDSVRVERVRAEPDAQQHNVHTGVAQPTGLVRYAPEGGRRHAVRYHHRYVLGTRPVSATRSASYRTFKDTV